MFWATKKPFWCIRGNRRGWWCYRSKWERFWRSLKPIGYRDQLCCPKWINISGKCWLRQFPFPLVQLPPPSNMSHLLTRYVMFEILLDSIKCCTIYFRDFYVKQGGLFITTLHQLRVYTFTVIPKNLQHYNLTKKLAAGLVGRSTSDSS